MIPRTTRFNILSKVNLLLSPKTKFCIYPIYVIVISLYFKFISTLDTSVYIRLFYRLVSELRFYGCCQTCTFTYKEFLAFSFLFISYLSSPFIYYKDNVNQSREIRFSEIQFFDINL